MCTTQSCGALPAHLIVMLRIKISEMQAGFGGWRALLGALRTSSQRNTIKEGPLDQTDSTDLDA